MKKIGRHSPKMTLKNFIKIEFQTAYFWADSSWSNDLCDSIIAQNDNLELRLFLPNSKKDNPNNEEFNTFSLEIYNNNTNEQKLKEFKSIKKLINYINNI